MDKKVKKSEILKKRIFNEAIALFTEHGFENVKVTDICRSLDIATGSFYYYFPSKEAIFLDYYQSADELLGELAEELSKQGYSYSEKLKKMMVEKIRAVSGVGQKMGNVCMSAFLKHLDDSFMDIKRSAYMHFLDIVRTGQESGEFRTDLEPEMIISSLRYVLSGLALHWACSSDVFDIDLEVEKQAEALIKAIKV